MGTRQRQVNKPQSNANNQNQDNKPNKSDSTSKMYKHKHYTKKKLAMYSLTVACALLLVVYIGLANDVNAFQLGNRAIDNLAFSLNLHTPFYVVIIDAGSTASRVIAFTFHRSVLNGQIQLDDELFYEIKPGLSAYAKNPKGVEKSLNALLEKAKTRIPKTEWSKTPLSMRATAGLRLLPDHEANQILEEAKKVFDLSGFQLSKDSVDIMDGSDEGIFSWFTVNFLLDKFISSGSNEDYSIKTVAALDLGGGSTQVTFAITPKMIENQSKELEMHKKNIYNINALDRNISILTQSFLGMGLMAARKSILTHSDNNPNKTAPENVDSDSIKLHSECINPIISGAEWNYGGKKYKIYGPVNGDHKIVKSQINSNIEEDRPIVRFPTCLGIIKKVVNDAIPHDLPVLSEHEIYAFSYYYDRATEVGLIDPFTGGTVTVDDLYNEALKSCEYPNTDQPFTCLDLSFIYTLLHDGFGLEKTTKINMKKKINGHELSWALGAAFNVLQTAV
ncbi:hypothetical protein TKK_0003462 [Trichogramma kaykai]|uniref:Ectonucleoside triphosphate diphosphohydrolase 5 n=1 Tax=Trichogramma kaykai TaxID=54128 RepID=A0ABD2XPN6_9HYME